MRPRSVGSRACVVVVTVVAATVLDRGLSSSAGAAVPTAQATIINAQDQSLYKGGSTTPFGLSLPGTGEEGQQSEASCANYSQSNPQELDSYLVPEGTDPSTVTFSDAGPSTGGGLFESGSYYGFITIVGTSGQLPSVPSDFAWEPSLTGSALTVPQLLSEGTTPGVWETGLACVNKQGADIGQVTSLWNVQVTFASSSSDPNGFTWTVPVPPPPTTTTTTSPPAGGSGTGSGGSGSGSSPNPSSASSSNSGSSTTTVPSVSQPSGSFDDDVGAVPSGSTSVSPSTAPTKVAPSGTASAATGSSGPGSDAPVKDPGILHDALTAAGFSSARGIALDILGIGLLLLVISLIRRRKSDGAEEPAS
jgi:hypothetical protein